MSSMTSTRTKWIGTRERVVRGTSKKSISANIGDAIPFLGFHWSLKVASKVLNVKCDARTREVNRHKWTQVFRGKSKSPLQPTSFDAISFLGFVWSLKVAWKVFNVRCGARTRKWIGTSGHQFLVTNPKSQLQPTSLMPFYFSASSDH